MTKPTKTRQAPFVSNDVERCMIGAALLDAAQLDMLRSCVWTFHEPHRSIAHTMLHLDDAGHSVNVETAARVVHAAGLRIGLMGDPDDQGDVSSYLRAAESEARWHRYRSRIVIASELLWSSQSTGDRDGERLARSRVLRAADRFLNLATPEGFEDVQRDTEEGIRKLRNGQTDAPVAGSVQ